jgi:ribose transport system permease protein
MTTPQVKTALPEDKEKTKVERRSGVAFRWRQLLAQRELGIFLVVLTGAIFLHFASGNFATKANLIALVLGLSFDAIVAVGMTVLLVSGQFDLSVGSTLALAGAVAGFAIMKWGASVPVGIMLGLLAGAAIGVANGLLVAKVRVNALIATLGMMSVGRGIVLLLTSGYGIPNLPDSFNNLAQGNFLGLQYPVWFMLFFVIVGDVLLRRSRFFRQSYFVGGNERSARLSGINVDYIKISNFVICGLMAAVAGLLLTGRFGTASVSAGVGTELRVISAVVIGGASLAGGEGTVLGALLGVTLMALISNGLNLLGINVYWQTIVIGAVLIIAVAADSLSRRGRS